jgi:DNA-binding NarL/FixJ family response regulator
MVAALLETLRVTRPNKPAWQQLPPCMRVLCILTRQRTGGWLADAFAADSASKIVLEEVVGTAAGLARLRDEIFDAVLVCHEPGELDALDLVEAYRTGGADDPIVVLGSLCEQEMAPLCYEVGADAYVPIGATTRNLVWVIARAVQRRQLVEENSRLTLAEQTRRQRESDDAADVLAEQRALLNNLGDASPELLLPDELLTHYRELLRTYVIMGSGNLADELHRLAELLVAAGLTAPQTMQLHLHALEELVQGLGTRSTRHVMSRADLLILELLLHLADGYRCRYQERIYPPAQQMLPGF